MDNDENNLIKNEIPVVITARDKKQKIYLWIFILLTFFVLCIGFLIGFFARRCDGTNDKGTGVHYESLSRKFQRDVSSEFLKQQQEIYSSDIHQSGSLKNNNLAELMAKNWKKWGLKSTQMFKYQVNKTVVNTVNPSTIHVLYNDTVIREISTIELKGQLHRYHAYSSGASVRGRFVFINYGRPKDLKTLKDLGIQFCNNRTIPIVRLGFTDRAAKVKNLVSYCGKNLPCGLLVYPDPWDYAVDFDNKNATPDSTPVYPQSWWLPGDAAVFGSMKMKSGLQSPGLPSLDGIFNTVNIEEMLTPFPVQPISYDDAKNIFAYMNGTEVPKAWEKCLAKYLQSKDNYEIQMVIKNSIAVKTIVNVIGHIPGHSEKDRYVILGNHRDAWAYGASDPGSGTIILQQVVSILSAAYTKGTFRPRRSVIFASWDGEEEGLLGSTEFTNQFSKDLSQRCIAYINIDCPIKGMWSFVGRSTPLLAGPMIDSSKNVFLRRDYTLFEDWKKKNPKLPDKLEPKVNPLGGGSDHNLFAYVLGVPSIYPEYSFNYSLPSMPAYHTQYDNIDMMNRIIDPRMEHHSLISKFIIDYIVRLSYEPVIPYSLRRLSDLLLDNFPKLKHDLDLINIPDQSNNSQILLLLTQFNETVKSFTDRLNVGRSALLNDPLKLRSVNDLLVQLPRMFITRDGLPNRPHLRNILLSTALKNSYLGGVFTGVVDAVELFRGGKVDMKIVLRQISLLTNCLRRSIDLLNGGLVKVF